MYILKCKDGSLYTGITNDVARRLAQHKAGKGGSYTRAKGAVKIVYSEEAKSKGDALRREAQIKRWSRSVKLTFLRANHKAS